MRIKILDAFRGFAALSVVLFHFTTNYRNDYSLPFDASYDFRYGYLGVELFFIISGFVIFMTIEKVVSLKEFILKRFIRLYPIYWFCLILSFSTAILGNLTNRIVSTTDFLINFTMLQSMFGVKNVDGSYWSLFFEILFYGFIGGIIFFKLKNKWLVLCTIWVLGTLVSKIFNIESYLINQLLLVGKYNCLFVIGICFYNMYVKGHENKFHHLIILISFLTYIYKKNYQADVYLEIIFLLCLIIVFYLFIFRKLDFLEHFIFQFFGQISYVLYLLHQNIGYVFIKYYIAYFKPSSIYFLVIPLCSLICLSYLIHKLIEKPLNASLYKVMMVNKRNI